jgi:hypothetical protein
MSDTHKRDPRPLAPFPVSRPAARRGWLERLLKRPRPDLAARALEALLTKRHPSTISRTELSDLLLHYGLSASDVRHVFSSTWRGVLTAFLADNALSAAEVSYLDALRGALALTASEVTAAERAVIHPRYEIAVHDALADARITEEERTGLTTLAQQLRLPPEVEQRIYARSAEEVLQAILSRAIADRRLSPEEQETLDTVARHLGVPIPVPEGSEALLDRFALFWRIENEGPPVIPWPMALAEGEACHIHCVAKRVDVRPMTHAEEGILAVRIARGVYFRAGSVSQDRVPLVPGRAVEGRLVISSRNVHFDAPSRRAAIPMRAISAFHVHADGIIFETASGQTSAFVLDGDVELIAVVLGAALARA